MLAVLCAVVESSDEIASFGGTRNLRINKCETWLMAIFVEKPICRAFYCNSVPRRWRRPLPSNIFILLPRHPRGRLTSSDDCSVKSDSSSNEKFILIPHSGLTDSIVIEARWIHT